MIANPANISDHPSTYQTVPHNYSVSCAYSRRIWLCKRADFAQLDDLLRLFNWKCLREGSLNDCCELFTNKFMEFVNSAITYKDVTVRLRTIQKFVTIQENAVVWNSKLSSPHHCPIGINIKQFVINLIILKRTLRRQFITTSNYHYWPVIIIIRKNFGNCTSFC